jgi:WD40 repeat protein
MPLRVPSRGRRDIATCAFALLLMTFSSSLQSAERFSVSLPAWANSLSFSPDSKRLAVGCADSCVHILETKSGKESLALRGHEDYVASVAFSPDGKTVATGSYDHTARVWDIESGRTRQTLRGHGGVVMSVAFSPDGKWLATGSLDTTVKL